MNTYSDFYNELNNAIKKMQTGKLLENYNSTLQIKDLKDIKELFDETFIFKIPSSLSILFVLTENEINKEEIKLPYDNIFLDTKFKLEDREFFGILLLNLIDEIRIFAFQRVIGTKRVNLMSFDLFSKGGNIEFDEKGVYENDIKRLIINFLYFINNPQLEFIQKDYTENEFHKSVLQKKVNGCSEIIVTGKLKKYLTLVENSIQNNQGLMKSHWVRGHWRNFYSERFVNKKGFKTWIYPYIRGFGEVIKKEYIIKEEILND